MNKPTPEQVKELWKICEEFIHIQEIVCAESICQCDNVIENAHELIEQICDVVGYHVDESS